jgi:periplasmic nitrate reductase NapD
MQNDLDRRRLLFGAAREIHICSLVVHAWPEQLDAVADAVAALPGAELHGRDPAGKLVVTLETETEDDILSRMNSIGDIKGVLSTSLVFQHHESES